MAEDRLFNLVLLNGPLVPSLRTPQCMLEKNAGKKTMLRERSIAPVGWYAEWFGRPPWSYLRWER